MIHDVASGAFGKVAELKSDVKEAERLNKKIFSMVDKNCEQPDGFFMKKLKEKDRADWYLTAKKAKKFNLVNHLRVPTFTVDVGVKIKIK
jgi:ATP-dependent protease ClpP protease subunit